MSATTQSPSPRLPSTESDDDPEAQTANSHPPPGEAIRDAFRRLAELKEFAAYYAAVRVDAIKATVRNVGIYAALGLMALAGGAALIGTAIVLLMLGVAGAFAQLFSGHPWLGDIITAVIFLAVIAVGAIVGLKILSKTFHSITVAKYESRQSRQREQFGRDVRHEAQRAEHSQS